MSTFPPSDLWLSANDLHGENADVVVIGSGPAATSVVEGLIRQKRRSVVVLERGGILLTSHVRNVWKGDREPFIRAHQKFLWDGAFANRGDAESGGMMLLNLGGRGIVAGAHLPRYYSEDFALWGELDGQWPISLNTELQSHFAQAEQDRHVSYGEVEGISQTWALGQLAPFHAHPPAWGVDVRSNRNGDVSRGYDSPAERLWTLLNEDLVRQKIEGTQRRLRLGLGVLVVGIKEDGDECQVQFVDSTSRQLMTLRARDVVLAASPIESARLFLQSSLPDPNQVGGRYLAEHIYCRAEFDIASRSERRDDNFINVECRPENSEILKRFQVDVEGMPVGIGRHE